MTSREPPTRLGRGLAALLGDMDAPTDSPHGGGGPIPVAIDRLEPGPFQPRGGIDDASLAELADSIRAQGILQPLLARPHPRTPGTYQIIAGERRWRAAQRAGLHELPVLIRPLSNAESMAAALVENLQRADLNAIEEGDGYRRLIEEFGLTQEKLAEAVGKSRSHIANSMRLLNLPPSVQQDLRRGSLTAGHARALLSHPDPAKAALAVIARGLSVRQTEDFAARARAAGEPASREHRDAAKDPDTRAFEQDLSSRIGLKVEIVGRGDAGTVRIHFRNHEQLDAIATRLTR